MRKGWVSYKFKDVATAVKGKLPKNKNEDGVGIPYLTANYLRSNTADFWIENLEGAVTAQEGDCLILWDGAGAGDLFSAKSGVVSSTMAVVTTNKSDILRDFLTLLISSKANYIKQTCRGTTVPHVSPDAISNMDLVIPPLPEQKRIVDLISSVDSYIDVLEQQAESARKSRSAVLHEMLSGGGEGWTETRLSEIASIRYGYTESASLIPNGPKFLRITDIQEGKVVWENVPYCQISDKELDSQKLLDGDIVFARTGATTGKSFLIKSPPLSVCASYLIRVRPNNEIIDSHFLSYYFSTDDYWNQVRASTSGSAQGGVNSSKLGNLVIKYPYTTQQFEIVSFIKSMDDSIFSTEKLIIETKQLRSGLLSDLLSGEHEIPECYDKVIGAA